MPDSFCRKRKLADSFIPCDNPRERECSTVHVEGKKKENGTDFKTGDLLSSLTESALFSNSLSETTINMVIHLLNVILFYSVEQDNL